MSTESPKSANNPQSKGESKGEIQDLMSQGTVVAGMTGLSRITGFIRDVVFSYFFGATGIADAFFVAFRIPNFFRRLFAEGAFAQGFIPVLATKLQSPKAQLQHFVALVAGNLSLVLFVVVLLGVMGADALVFVFAPGFRDNPQQLALTVELVRITFPYLFFIALTAMCAAVLNSHHRYAIPAITPVILNVVLIGAAFVATPFFEVPVLAFAWAVFVAGAIQLLFQFPALKREQMLVRPKLGVNDKDIQKLGKLLLPAIFASSVSQINGLIDTILASLLATGSISWLYYSDRLLELPLGLVAIALGTVLLPNLSRLHNANDKEGFAATVDWGLSMGLLFALPATVALYMLAQPLIASIFFHGALTSADVIMASLSLQAFSVGLLSMVAVRVLSPAYFSRQDTKTPFKIATVAISVNVILNFASYRWFGHVGLALATAIAAIVNSYLLLRGLISGGFYQPGRKLALLGFRCGIATLMMAVFLWLTTAETAAWLTMSVPQRVMAITIACVGGVGVYVGCLLLIGVRPTVLKHSA